LSHQTKIESSSRILDLELKLEILGAKNRHHNRQLAEVAIVHSRQRHQCRQ